MVDPLFGPSPSGTGGRADVIQGVREGRANTDLKGAAHFLRETSEPEFAVPAGQAGQLTARADSGFYCPRSAVAACT